MNKGNQKWYLPVKNTTNWSRHWRKKPQQGAPGFHLCNPLSSTPNAWLSSIALLPWLLDFPPQAFPITTCCLRSPRSASLQSTAALALGLLHNPCIPAPRHCLGDLCPCLGYDYSKDWFSFHLGCHRSAVSLSALNVSPLTQTIALMWGQMPASFSPTAEAGPVLVFPPLVPLSYRVFHPSIYCFPAVRYSCLLSGGVLQALLCLKVHSWCICGKRCTPHPPTHLPSLLPFTSFLTAFFYVSLTIF